MRLERAVDVLSDGFVLEGRRLGCWSFPRRRQTEIVFKLRKNLGHFILSPIPLGLRLRCRLILLCPSVRNGSRNQEDATSGLILAGKQDNR